jgi:hypothetical protein
MSGLRPTPQQERWITVAERAGVGLDHRWVAERIGGWTVPSLIARCALFILGAVAAGLTFTVFDLLHVPGEMLLAGITLLIAAEWLVLRRHLFRGGVEEALWMAGSVAVVLQFRQPNDLDSGSALLVVLTLAAGGIRLLSPLFVTLAAVAASCAIAMIGGKLSVGEPALAVPAAVFCYATAAISLFVGQIEFRRPSYDRMVSWLMLIMPVCGLLWLALPCKTLLPIRFSRYWRVRYSLLRRSSSDFNGAPTRP